MKHFGFAPASFLDAIRIAVEDFEDGQRLKRVGKLACHVQGRRQRHHGVKAGGWVFGQSSPRRSRCLDSGNRRR
jgi:hypothetical protein